MLNQKLIITYSNQRIRELKTNSKLISSIDKVITLDDFIIEEFEKKNFKIIIDELIASSIIYKAIKDNSIDYFDYLKPDDDSLDVIYDFILKCNRNEISFSNLLSKEKLEAIKTINLYYQRFKTQNNLVDISDMETYIFENFDELNFSCYEEVYIDDFIVDKLSFIKSKKQEDILNKFSKFKSLQKEENDFSYPKILKTKNEVFDNIDEVKTAIKIARKLMQNGVSDNEILIVTTDINEYGPLYKLFLDEYEMKGYSSLGTKLNAYYNNENPNVKNALLNYKSKIKELENKYNKLGLTLTENLKEKIKSEITIKDKKVGIELTETNQLLGTSKRYNHIIFLGTDINHFPPKAKDNFLYSYADEIKYFYKDDFFLSSQIQYEQMKKLCDNLYIITATHFGKRELTPSIIIDKKFDETYDVNDILSINDLASNKITQLAKNENDEEFYSSIKSKEFTKFDGIDVDGIKVKHLSASQINKYNSCPLLYFYTNKLKLKAPGVEEEGFDAAQRGSLMHLCFELFGLNVKERALNNESFVGTNFKKLMYDISLDAYKQFLDENDLKENINHKIFLSSLHAGLLDDRSSGLLAKFVEYFITHKDIFKYFKYSEFEKEFALDDDLKPYKLKDENDRDYFIKGFIDRFDILDNEIEIIDYKSKKVKKLDKEKMEQIRELKDVQLALYILYASQEYPNKEYYASLLSFKTTEPYAYFANLANTNDQNDYEYYSEDYEKDLKKLIFEVKENIENGKFNFDNSDEKNCEWCDIKFMCSANILSKQSNREMSNE